MKKNNIYVKFSLLVLTGSIITLSACNNQSEEAHNEAIKSGMDALISEDYEKAEVFFEIASEEKNNDERTQNLLAQTISFNEAKIFFNEGNLMKAAEEAEKVITLSNGSEALVKKASTLIEDINKVNDTEITFQNIYDEAEQLFVEGNNEEALEKIEGLLQEEKLGEIYYVAIKTPGETLKHSIEKEISKVAEKAAQKQEVEAQEAESIAQVEKEQESVVNSDEISKKVKEYRNQIWYGKGEDPNYTYENAISIIKNVIGPEDSSFFYNGRTEVYMTDDGRLYYGIWQEATTGDSTAQATIASYEVYEDGIVEDYVYD